MKSLSSPKIFLPFTLLFSILAISAMACSVGGISVDKDSATVEVTLTENQLNNLFENAATQTGPSDDNLLDKVTSVELHDGFIRVFGETKNADGNTVSGSYDVSFGAENDALKVEVIAVDIPGIDMDDERIVDANQKLSKELAETVTESNGEVLFKEATVTEEALKLKVQVLLK